MLCTTWGICKRKQLMSTVEHGGNEQQPEMEMNNSWKWIYGTEEIGILDQC